MIRLLPFVCCGHLFSFVATEMLKEHVFSSCFALDRPVHKLQPLLQVAPTASAGPPRGSPLSSLTPVVEAKNPEARLLNSF